MGTYAAYVVAAACIGYGFCLHCYCLKYSLARKEGWYAYLHCTSFGLLFLAVGILLPWDFLIFDWLASHSPTSSDIGRDSCKAIIVGAITLIVVNSLISKDKSVASAWRDDLDALLWTAIENDLPVQVSVDSRKVYVGMVYDTLQPELESSYLSIIPYLGGYRDNKTLSLKITHKYELIINGLINKEIDLDKYKLVIPRSKIVTCHVFDLDVHESVLEQNTRGLGASLMRRA